MTPLANTGLRWLIFALLLFVLISALRFGSAEFFSLNARRNMEEWKATQSPPVAEQILSVVHQLDIARFLADSNPDHHEDIARLFLIRAALPDTPPDAKQELLLQGMLEIRTSISLRPVSPYSWTILLMLKRDLHEFDAEFRHALHRAIELGPWEPELLTAVADVGLSAWDDMPLEEQALIQQVFVRGLEHQDELMHEVSHAHRNACTDQKVTCQ